MNAFDVHQAGCVAALLLHPAATVLLVAGLHRGADAPVRWAIAIAVAGLIAHGLALGAEVHAIGGLPADLFSSLSLLSWVIVAVLLAGVARYPFRELLPVALPGAVAMIALDLFAGPGARPLATGSAALDAHVIASLLAYGLLAIGALNAVFISAQHWLLRQHRRPGLLGVLPPLVSMENLLFRLIGTGWVLLTVSLVTGLLFVERLFAQHLAHKTLLSVVAWLVFGLLLAGRWKYGWRGMRVVRLCLIGMAILVLAYVGSKAVLELLLDRQWQAAG
ncbi:MAG: cytochrome c biogenesis protein CcsA [Wenzhouxiangellaceae bacterium]|nr:cytochrome c biogenesis protein CcsA [Wenzhouxiangellaceae bacterium]